MCGRVECNRTQLFSSSLSGLSGSVETRSGTAGGDATAAILISAAAAAESAAGAAAATARAALVVVCRESLDRSGCGLG